MLTKTKFKRNDTKILGNTRMKNLNLKCEVAKNGVLHSENFSKILIYLGMYTFGAIIL